MSAQLSGRHESLLDVNDTIAAIASAPGGAARGIVRVSGPDSFECVLKCFRPDDNQTLLEPRFATVTSGVVHLDTPRALVPCDLYLWPDDRSYTRQPAAELHLVGSPPLVSAVLRAVCAAGARLAEPGEFTMRAFLAGRLDLTQAEAVLGVIDANDRRELDVALVQLAGGMSRPLGRLRDELLELLAHVEAGLDFVEEDIEFVTKNELETRLSAAADSVDRLLAQMEQRGDARDAVRVILVGWPNVGKSSLFNALIEGPQALVSPVAGTTRDYVTATLSIEGLSCELVDTAGVEPASAAGSLTRAAQDMTAEQRGLSLIKLFCLDATRPLNDWEREEISKLRDDTSTILVLTKADAAQASGKPHMIDTSSRTGEGIEALRDAIRRAVLSEGEVSSVTATAARCRESLRLAGAALFEARQLVDEGGGEELVAVEVRTALDELGRVVGAVYTDDVLDLVFRRFCIGK